MSLRVRLRTPATAALVGGLVAGLLALGPAPSGQAEPAAAERVRPEQRLEPDAVFKRSSYLCYGYQDCRQKGMGNAGYAKNSRTMYWRMYAGHNCTNYAAYRMVRSGLPNERPWSGGGNAEYWGTSMPRITDGVPRVGAVAWWKANAGPAGSSGHVAYVEEVVSADEIVISQDSWGGDFSWAVVTRGSGNWPSGFIHFNDVAMVNRAAPKISGTTKVGSTLNASPGSWRPGDVEVKYQWYADGKKLPQQRKAKLRLTQARVGQMLTVTATATKLGYPSTSASSSPTGRVLPGQLSNTGAPAITGTAQVEGTLALDTGAWDPKPHRFTVRWYADGRLIEGTDPNATTLSLTPDLVDRVITAGVTAERTGYDPVEATTAPTARVAPGIIRVTTAPRVQGTPKLGETLKVVAGSYSPQDAQVSVQWLRDGELVPNATGPTYQLFAPDLGARITAQVTLSRHGYTRTTAESAATTPVKTDPRLQVRVERIKKRIRVQVAVTAPGIDAVAGTVTVRIGGVAKQAVLRRNGTVRVVLRGLKPGERTLRVNYGGADAVSRATYTRPITVR